MKCDDASTRAHLGARIMLIVIGALIIITVAGAIIVYHSVRGGLKRGKVRLIGKPSVLWDAWHQRRPTAVRIKLALATDYERANTSAPTDTINVLVRQLPLKALLKRRAPGATLALYMPTFQSSRWWTRQLITSHGVPTTWECHVVISPVSGMDRWAFIPKRPLAKSRERQQRSWRMNPQATSLSSERIASIQASLRRLPNCPADYSPVEAIWLSHPQLWRLTRAQLDALNAWLFSGGVLVLDATQLDERSIVLVHRLWNLRILGKGAMVSPQVLSDALPKSVRIPPHKYPTVKVALGDWEVTLAEDYVPLVIMRKLGYGRIIALLMDAGAHPKGIAARRLGWWLVNEVKSCVKDWQLWWFSPGWLQPYPSLWLVIPGVILVALMLLFIPRFFLVLNRFRKGWFAAVTVAIIVSIIMIALRILQGEVRYAQVNFLMLQSGSRAAGLVSILRLRSSNRRMAIWHSRNALRLIPCDLQNVVCSRELPSQGISHLTILSPSESAIAVMGGMVDIGGPITASVKLKGYRWHVRMRNDSRLTLRDIAVVLKGKHVDMPWYGFSTMRVARKLRPSERVEATAKTVGVPYFLWKLLRTPLLPDENLILIARCAAYSAPLRRILATKGKQYKTIILISPRVEPSESTLIHPSVLSSARAANIARERAGILVAHPVEWRVSFGSDTKIGYVQMPIKLHGIDNIDVIERLTLTLQSLTLQSERVRANVNFKLYAYNFKARRWQALPRVATGMSQGVWRIDRPRGYIHPLTREVWIRLRIYAPSGGEVMTWVQVGIKAYLRGDEHSEHNN